jgi:hypothetical protein
MAETGSVLLAIDSFNEKTEIEAKIYVENGVNGGNVAGENITIGKQEIHHHYPPAETKTEPPKVDIYHLPKPTTALIGRKTELAQLTEALPTTKPV